MFDRNSGFIVGYFVKGVAASSISHYIAALADLGTLLGSLESIQAKWYNFGLQLRVDVGQLDAIAVQYSNPLDCLRETLKQWLKTSLNCTWECIVDALGSSIVGANALALELERKHCPQLDACVSEAQAAHAQEQTFYSHWQAIIPTLHQGAQFVNFPKPGYGSQLLSYSRFYSPIPRPTYSYTSNSTPIQFQLASTHTSQPPHIKPHASNLPSFNPQCHVGEPPPAAKRPHFTPHTTPLNPASPCTGSYTSQPQVRFSGASSVLFSTPPAVDRYAKYLREYYKSCGVVTEDTKWPPTPTVHYINLAYISLSNVTRHEVEDFTRAAVLGKIEDIVRVKKPLSFEEVACMLPNGSLPRIVLVEGAPGVGKTTFVWEACRRWGNGEILQQYSLVVVLRLRDKRIREANVLCDLFYHSNKVLLQSVVQEIEDNLGENLLLILEGLDELPEELREQSSIFLDLMHGRLLPKATILVTTRPWASGYLHEHCSRRIDQHIEILGFTKDQVDCYLESVLGGDSETLADINEYLARYPQIHAAITIPLNAAIVVCVYNESRTGKCVLPRTMTELYTALAQTLLLRYVHEHPTQDINVQLHSFTDLHVPPYVSKSFHQLSKVAYDGIKNSQQLIFADLPKNFETLGFMQAVPELYVSKGLFVSHNFVHLTIQEYLAAVYITQLSPEEQLKHIEECGRGLFKVVMRFFVGLSKFSEIPLDSVRALLGKPKYDPNTRYHVKCDYSVNSDHVNWMFETQAPDTINAILGSGKTIEFDFHSFSMPFDYYCLGYCIAHSNCQWKLVFQGTTEEQVKLLTAGGSALHISEQNTSVVSIQFRSIYPATMTCLFDTLHLHIRVDLQELIGEVDFPGLIRRLRRLPPSLKVLTWTARSDLLSVEDLRELCVLLASSAHNLKIIKIGHDTDGDGDYDADDHRNLNCTFIYPEDPSYLTIEGTYQHTSVSVDVRVTDVDDVTSSESVLTENSNLGLHFTAFKIWGQLCKSDLACRLAEALHGTVMLKTLKVIHCLFETKDVMALVKLLHSNKLLEEVNFNNFNCYNIIKDGACDLAHALCENTRVKKLSLCNSPIGTKGAMALAKLIHTTKSLEEVKLNTCHIGSEGVCHLAQALCENTTVKILSLSYNCIGSKGTMALAKLIRSNTSLEEISMKDCRIDSEGACHLSQALCKNTTLRRLALSHSPIGTNEVMYFAKLMHSNRSLEKVDLRFCNINSEGLCHLVQALHGNTSLRLLMLSDNPIGQGESVKDDIHKILKAVAENSTLQTLHLPRESKVYAESFPTYNEISIHKVAF